MAKHEDVRTRKILARNIRSRAAERNVTLNRLADFAGISRAHLFHILAGTRGASIDVVAKIASHFDLEAWELLVPPKRKRA